MKFSQLATRALLLEVTHALVPQNRSSSIQWGDCGEKLSDLSEIPISCARLPVPLDYTDDSSTDTIRLSLLKVDALVEPVKGTILVNFGGPGLPTIAEMAQKSEQLLKMTGGHYNLLGFDPRGTGQTLTFSCYNSELERALAQGRVAERLANSSSTAVGRIWDNGQIVANECYAAQGDKYGELVGTAFVARDMMEIVDALNEDGLLKYWGFSYGTLLGATVVAMFPDRMDKVILDGVVNPFQYYHDYDQDLVESSDDVAAGFFSGCVEHPDYCALSRLSMNAMELESIIYDLFEGLKYDPLPLDDTILDYSTAKSYFVQQLYSPSQWAATAIFLDLLYARNSAAIIELLSETSSDDSGPENSPNEAYNGIRCGDKGILNDTFETVLDVYEKEMATSKWLGDGMFDTDSACAQWKMEARERYTGDFKVKAKNPILIIGNTYDPVTPLASAKNLTETLEGSALLEQKGYGHASPAQASRCTTKVIQDYLNKGVLPESGTTCEVDDILFQTGSKESPASKLKLKSKRR